jgi:hypothetical protein
VWTSVLRRSGGERPGSADSYRSGGRDRTVGVDRRLLEADEAGTARMDFYRWSAGEQRGFQLRLQIYFSIKID